MLNLLTQLSETVYGKRSFSAKNQTLRSNKVCIPLTK